MADTPSTEREAFEAAMRQEGMNDRELEKNEHGKYVDLTTGWAYAAWSARAALSAPADTPPITAEREPHEEDLIFAIARKWGVFVPNQFAPHLMAFHAGAAALLPFVREARAALSPPAAQTPRETLDLMVGKTIAAYKEFCSTEESACFMAGSDGVTLQLKTAPVAAPPADPLLGQALAALVRYANACDADAKTVAVIQALEARIDAAPPAAVAAPTKMFPIMSSGKKSKPIPWSVLAPFEHRAQRNHSQSLQRLAERGGLGHSEALAVLRDVDFRDVKERGVDAVLALEALVAERIATAAPPAASGVDALWVEQAMELLDNWQSRLGSRRASCFEGDKALWDRIDALRTHLSTALTGAKPAPAAPSDAQIRWHELKTDPDVFDAVASGAKTHEIRRDDRNFKVGDGLLLRRTKFTGAQMHMRPEACPLEYTGDECRRIVSHVLSGYGLEDGWVILSFAPAAPAAQDADRAAQWLVEVRDQFRQIAEQANQALTRHVADLAQPADSARQKSIREDFDLIADAHMQVFGMAHSPAREQAWDALKTALERNMNRG